MTQCPVPNEQLSLGFCYSPCPAGYTGQGSACIANCPAGFIDHGSTCEPPTVTRQPGKPYLEPCGSSEIEQNGNCFEPQTFSWYNQVSGCGCIKKTMTERVKCPTGYVVYNNACLPQCPPGYTSITDATGNLVSAACTKLCPPKPNSRDLWSALNGQCVKDVKSRMATATSSANTTVKSMSKPKSMLSSIASSKGGSNVLERSRVGMGSTASGPLGDGLGDGVSDVLGFLSNIMDGSFLGALAQNLDKLLWPIAIIVLLIFLGPSLLPGLGKGVGALLQYTGIGVGKVVEATGTVAAKVETAVGENVAEVVRIPAAQARAVNDAASNVAIGESAATAATKVQALAAAEKAFADASAAVPR